MENLLTVVAVSSNANSFGLKSVILFADNGEAWQGLSNDLYLPSVGTQYYSIPRGWECVTDLPKPPAKLLRKAIKDALATVTRGANEQAVR